METTVSSNSVKRRRNKKRRKRPKCSELNLKQHPSAPSRQLTDKKVVLKKQKGKKVNKMTEQCPNSFIMDYNHQISIVRSQVNQNCMNHQQFYNDVFEQTVDLCNDTSIDSPNSSLLIVPTCEVKQKNETVIDLSIDPPKENEVIDLTEPPGAFQDATTNLGPTVIDITEDESKDKPNSLPENEEILVVGTFTKSCNNFHNTNSNSSLITLSNNFNYVINCKKKLGKRYFKKNSVLNKICDGSAIQYVKEVRRVEENSCPSKVPMIGENVYVNAPVTLPSHGLRPIIIDGSNVAFVYSSSNFSCKRLEICINYFKERGHKVTAFVPQFRINSQKSDDPQLLRKLERRGDVVLTPSKKIDGKNIVPYDDRFIVQTAVLKGGIIVTRDNYNDLLKENPTWAETIKYRTLAFTWVDDVLMFPKDPLGEYGPSLEEFLRFN